MPENINKLELDLNTKLEEARKIHETAKAESRGFTEEENGKYTGLMAEIENVRATLTREKELEARALELYKQEQNEISEKIQGEFDGNFGEFVRAVLAGGSDPRLNEARQQAMGVGVTGGFMVGTQWSDDIKMITPQDALIRPRATVIPAGSPPDSAISFPALDQTGIRGVYSGVTVNWVNEGGAKPETAFRLREITITPQECAAYIPFTDKLLRNSLAADALGKLLLRRAIIAEEDVQFLTGGGAGTPLGMVGHPGVVQVARTGFPSVAPGDNYTDLVNMVAAVIKGGPLVFIYSPTLLTQLMTMTDVNGNLIWTQSAREGEPNRLMGYPAFENERSPVAGQPGDLMLANLSHYYIKDGSGIFIEASQHVRFLSNQTVIKATFNVDGQPGLTTPLLLEDGVTQRSPFVQLT